MARPSHSDHVLQQLNNQREWGFLCDCCIAIGDFYFRAHKAVLAACSSYFRMLFIRDQQGAARLDLSNLQISAECFDLILQLMYLGRIAVGSYEFSELKASMSYLQMYYVPDSLDDLQDLRTSSLTPSSSSSSSTGGPAGGKMMFGVRMYEQHRPAAAEPDRTPKVAPVAPPRLAAEEASAPPAAAPPPAEGLPEQPCDLRKRPGGRGPALKERPRFGRTYTCDDCGFVFSCEKLLIEHILTCTNRKALPPPRPGDTDDSGRAESSASDGPEEPVCKGEEEWPADLRSVAAGTDVSVKAEPEDGAFTEIQVVRVGERADRTGLKPVRSENTERLEASSGEESGPPAKLRRVKREEEPREEEPREEEPREEDPCELCGELLGEEDRSSHLLSSHMGHICACGRCGQVLIRGRQLQEHAERCGEAQGEAESDSHGEDDASLPEEAQGPDEPLEADLACPHCGLLFQGDGPALEHALLCPEPELLRPALLDDTEPDHRRKHFCSLCGKGFYQRCHLREHYTVHTKEKQFTCPTCGKQFLRERQLRLHTDMHRGMARYLCPVCDQGTFLKHDHVRHMISHLAPGETICQVCFQIFPGGEQLEKHMDVHLYICGVCGEKFRLRKDMRSHYNAKHTKRL